MKYAIEIGPGAMIYIRSFIKIGLGIQKVIWGDSDTQTNRQHGNLISLLLFFKNKDSTLKIKCNCELRVLKFPRRFLVLISVIG
jgi:hypothetical protein